MHGMQSGVGTASYECRAKLVASLTADKTSGTVPLAVTFTLAAASGYPNYSWSLDYGDGSALESGSGWTGASFTRTHTYQNVGTYTAKLTVIDALGTGVTSILQIGGSTVRSIAAFAGPFLFAGTLAFIALRK